MSLLFGSLAAVLGLSIVAFVAWLLLRFRDQGRDEQKLKAAEDESQTNRKIREALRRRHAAPRVGGPWMRKPADEP